MRIHITTAYLNRSRCGSVADLPDAARRIAERSAKDGRCKTFVYMDRGGGIYASRQGKSGTLQVMCLRGRARLLSVFVNESDTEILAALMSQRVAA